MSLEDQPTSSTRTTDLYYLQGRKEPHHKWETLTVSHLEEMVQRLYTPTKVMHNYPFLRIVKETAVRTTITTNKEIEPWSPGLLPKSSTV